MWVVSGFNCVDAWPSNLIKMSTSTSTRTSTRSKEWLWIRPSWTSNNKRWSTLVWGNPFSEHARIQLPKRPNQDEQQKWKKWKQWKIKVSRWNSKCRQIRNIRQNRVSFFSRWKIWGFIFSIFVHSEKWKVRLPSFLVCERRVASGPSQALRMY